MRLEINLGQLADSIHQLRNLFVKEFNQLIFCGGGIFNDIMQNSGHKALVIHMHLGQDAGYSQWMKDVGLTGFARLAFMGFTAKLKGAAHLMDLIRFEVGG
jgi:hypothetical protein